MDMMKKMALGLIGMSAWLQAVNFEHTWNDWATHQPVLYEMVMRTSGPIIEFGCGNGSTDLLHELCRQTNRLLITVEDDFEWMSKFTEKYMGDGYEPDNSGWHKFFFVPGKSITDYANADHWIYFLEHCELLKNIQFDVCFVDQSPWQGRVETIIRLKDKSRYVILHDCDYFCENKQLGITVKALDSEENIPGIYDFSQTFRYFKLYFPLKPWPGRSGPPTLLASNFESDLPDIDYSAYIN